MSSPPCILIRKVASDLPITSDPERHKIAMRSKYFRAFFSIAGVAIVLKFRIFSFWKLLIGVGKISKQV